MQRTCNGILGAGDGDARGCHAKAKQTTWCILLDPVAFRGDSMRVQDMGVFENGTYR